jgi:histidyl-tRNA synthetase
MTQVGGDPLPATGFAMGDLAIGLLLESLGLIPKELSITPVDILVTVFDAEIQKDSLAISSELRQAGLNVICSNEPSKLPKQFKFADRVGASVVVVIGPDEVAKRQITIKDLINATQQTIDRSQVIFEIKKLLDCRRPL